MLEPAPAHRVIPRFVARWLADARPGTRVPAHVDAWLEMDENRANAIAFTDRFGASEQMAAALADFERTSLDAWQGRRLAEQALAWRIIAMQTCPSWARRVADSMLQCRTHGVLGQHQDGQWMARWDHKCGYSRLCPDESRTQTMRLQERYVPAIRRWVALGRPWAPRRVYSAVFTAPNIEPGRLAGGRRWLWEKFKAWQKQHPEVAGCLAVMEDPLSADGGWNVHINVILLAAGRFDYAAVRESWGCNVHLQKVKPDGLESACRELVKYAAAHLGTKSASKAAEGSTKAPPLVEYGDAALLEWLAVQVGSKAPDGTRRAPDRRVRSYGALYQLDALRWREARQHDRRVWCAKADPQVDIAAADDTWRRLDKLHGEGTRDTIRALWEELDGAEEERARLARVAWLGTIRWQPDRGLMGAYCVDLIRANNLASKSGVSDGRRPQYVGSGGLDPPPH